MAPDHYARRTARVVLLDGGGRVLLFRCHLRPEAPAETGWFTPGGGVADGEPVPAAAARELWEETGLAVSPGELGAPVAVSSGHAEWGWVNGWCRDDYFHYRVTGHQVDPGRREAGERAAIIEHRWWTAAELAGTAEVIIPTGLAALVADLAAGRIPPEPVQLPWDA